MNRGNMAYQVIARKFRPQSFTEFVGQTHITETLRNALAQNRFPHALLLTGPRGTGKTTTARIIAKTLLCQNPQDYNPCGQCQSCLDIKDDKHLDVIEIDGASNNGVDHIRELRETVGYMPSSGAYKIYIIDEVHMLSSSAFNALLKTLEEPPEHVIFIFATTEVHKIPATILSRCQRFDFRNHTLSDIKNHLLKICQQEGITFEDEALWLIAQQAKGSMRDSLTLIDQLISFSQGKLTAQRVLSALGLTDRILLLDVLSALAEQNEKKLTEHIERFKTTGLDPLLFIEDFLTLLRNTLLVKMGAHQERSLEISESDLLALQALAPHLAKESIHLLFDVALSGHQRIASSFDPLLGLEMLLYKLLFLPRLTQSLNTSTDPARQTNTQTDIRKQSTGHSKTQNIDPATVPLATQIEPQPTPEESVSQNPPTVNAAATQPKQPLVVPVPALEPVGRTWPEFVHAIKQVNGFLGALLEHTSIIQEDEHHMVLGLPEKMAFLMDKLKDSKNIERTQNFLVTFWQESKTVEFTLLDKKNSAQALSPKELEERAKVHKQKKEADTIEAHPLVRATEAVFKDSITPAGVRETTKPPLGSSVL